MSNVLALYHVVFTTKFRSDVITEDACADLYRVIAAKVTDSGSRLLCVNGVGNHVHLLIDLSPRVALSDFVGHLKQTVSIWMSASGKFPRFEGWGREYFAHTVSAKDSEAVKGYIENQKIHHAKVRFDDELRHLVEHVGLQYFDNVMR